MHNYVGVNRPNKLDTYAGTLDSRDGPAFCSDHGRRRFPKSPPNIPPGPSARPRCAVRRSPIRHPQPDSSTRPLHPSRTLRVENHAESYPCHLNLFCCPAHPSAPRPFHGVQAPTLAPRESLVLPGGESRRFLISVALLADTLSKILDNRGRPVQSGHARRPRCFLRPPGVHGREMGLQQEALMNRKHLQFFKIRRETKVRS